MTEQTSVTTGKRVWVNAETEEFKAAYAKNRGTDLEVPFKAVVAILATMVEKGEVAFVDEGDTIVVEGSVATAMLPEIARRYREERPPEPVSLADVKAFGEKISTNLYGGGVDPKSGKEWRGLITLNSWMDWTEIENDFAAAKALKEKLGFDLTVTDFKPVMDLLTALDAKIETEREKQLRASVARQIELVPEAAKVAAGVAFSEAVDLTTSRERRKALQAIGKRLADLHIYDPERTAAREKANEDRQRERQNLPRHNPRPSTARGQRRRERHA